MTRLLRVVLLAAFGAAIAFLGFHQLALSGLIFGKGDAFHYFTPLWAARDAALRAFEFPLWTDNLFMGAPLLADSQLGTFYPPNWVTAALPAWEALKISVFAHVALAAAGAYLLARRTLGVSIPAAVIGAGVFALGGYVGAHAEQINQLQGIAWMPWVFWCLPVRGEKLNMRAGLAALFPLALVLALIALSGHTQTLFITGVGLGIYALVPQRDSSARAEIAGIGGRLLVIGAAAGLALALAAIQILPTLEVTGLSNRNGGFSAQAAMAFSWQPNLAARGLLPSLDGQVFSEYVAYLGVAGLALAVWGALYGGGRRLVWLILALVGVIFAFGLYNPLYWLLAELPGFNLFRVPARWLGLFALGGAMLAALGAQALTTAEIARPRRGLLAVIALLGGLAILAVWRSPAAALEVDGAAAPTLTTLIFWCATGLLFANAVLLRGQIPPCVLMIFIAALTLGELAIAATNMPHRDLVDPMAASDPRQTVYHLAADPLHGRALSFSPAYFDTYDHAGLLERYAELGMTERAIKAGLTAAKLKEILAPNFPLLYGVRSADGFGGGLLPSVYYSAFTSLLFPDGAPRTIDGRLRETLAAPDCLGACIPERRWLDLMGIGYLIRDKTYDRFYDDVQFDLVGLPFATDGAVSVETGGTVADTVLVLASSDDLALDADGLAAPTPESRAVEDNLTLLRYLLGEAAPLEALAFTGTADIHAVSLLDSRTGAFAMFPPSGWHKTLSSDVKIYRTDAPAPFAIAAGEVIHQPDDWNGSEAALHLMRPAGFDPLQTVILHGAPEALAAETTDVTITRAGFGTNSQSYEVTVRGGTAIILFNDAYFPGWKAFLNGDTEIPLYRADVMFRAVAIPEGQHALVISYQPAWLTPLMAAACGIWALFALFWLALKRFSPAT